ncbi:hypothetical protein Sjap_009350 [Stephania japonica]|uniref:Uncharacterized protein n=1 Tax=Stephania japonica TaxID=461633 RepID=A0AAP0JR74_9MAGN
MGSVASKRVEKTLAASPDFSAAVGAAYRRALDLSERAFPGVRRYQLYSAAAEIHRDLLSGAAHRLVNQWLPSPPTRVQVDRAAAAVAARRRRRGGGGDEETLDEEEFMEFAVEAFREGIFGNASRAVLTRVPVGLVGIGGIGVATRSGGGVVGSVMGVYAVGVAVGVYLSLC